jgi:hypothetical protein
VDFLLLATGGFFNYWLLMDFFIIGYWWIFFIIGYWWIFYYWLPVDFFIIGY